jgi:integrase
VFGIKGGDAKFDYRSGGNGKWRERIDATRLERLTADRINRWAQDHIAKAGQSPAAGLSARRTVNSYIRCSRSLFSTRRKNGTASLLEHIEKRLGTKLALPLPFQGVGLFEAGSMRYRSTVNVQALITAARQQLKTEDPEAYKAFVLGLFAGMRRAEIDGLTWDMIDWTSRTIRLKETATMRLKTEGSADDIALDPEVAAELRAMMPQSESPFVIVSDRRPRGDSLRAYYRCDPVFDRLTAWLRVKGITSNKPLHELRKEIGAVIATEQGIYAASRFLRHSDITTTARHYADQKTAVRPGIGNLLNVELKIVPKADTGS